MNQTPNYQLSQWDAEDRVLRTDFNADNEKIDAAIKAVSDRVDSQQTTLNQHTSSLKRVGNCQIQVTSYTGTGQFGVNRPNSLYFSKQPLVVFIVGQSGARTTLVRNMTLAHATADRGQCWTLNVTWSGSSVQWYNTSVGIGQLNFADEVYTVVALMTA